MNTLYLGQDGTQNKLVLSNLLVVGKTGSGKCNFLHRYINDLFYSYKPEELRLILADPKNVIYNDQMHFQPLLFHITNQEQFKKAMEWVSGEIDERLKLSEKRTPVLIIVEELGEFMIADSNYTEIIVQKIVDNSEQTKIYLLLSTARADSTILSENLLSSFNKRLVFAVNSVEESQLVLNSNGAEIITNPGECLYKDMTSGEIQKLQIPYIQEK